MKETQVGSTQVVTVDTVTLRKHKKYITIWMDFVDRDRILLTCYAYSDQRKAEQPTFITDRWIETALEKTGYLDLVEDISLSDETWLNPTVEVTLKTS